VTRGMSALFWRRTMATSRITGTDTNMIKNAIAKPMVVGKPRRTRLK
jgi:hypothetical protein